GMRPVLSHASWYLWRGGRAGFTCASGGAGDSDAAAVPRGQGAGARRAALLPPGGLLRALLRGRSYRGADPRHHAHVAGQGRGPGPDGRRAAPRREGLRRAPRWGGPRGNAFLPRRRGRRAVPEATSRRRHPGRFRAARPALDRGCRGSAGLSPGNAALRREARRTRGGRAPRAPALDRPRRGAEPRAVPWARRPPQRDVALGGRPHPHRLGWKAALALAGGASDRSDRSEEHTSEL